MTDGGDSQARRDSTPPLFPPRWDELAPLIDKVLDAPEEQRKAVIDALTKDNPDLHADLVHLIEECERDAPLLDRPAAENFANLFADDNEPAVTGTLGERYDLQREVGRGGMARVFLARDLKHNRDVAVKIVRDDVAASIGSARFLKEIAIAARLRHPNIVPMYDSGESDGVLYLVMPYEEGPSLRQRMVEQPPLEIPERINILRDIARALAYAHERGVVHRDIKPDNVILSGGAAVVSDFGIAKAVSAAMAEPTPALPTELGSGIGTPAYMAPEQAVGDPATDHRADIYSFGCLAYELFAGRPPFDKATTHETIAAHRDTQPAVLGELSADVPRSIGSLVMDCLQKRPADRPPNSRAVLRRLEENSNRAHDRELVRLFPRSLKGRVIAGVAMSSIVAGAYFAARYAGDGGVAPREMTVAVLPLLSSGDSVEHELAYGLSDEIATALVKVPGVRVMSRRGAASTREGQDIDPALIGRTLGAQYLVTVSLRQVSGRLTVLATLVQANNGSVLWAEQFDRDIDDLGLVREEIARSVGDSLRKRSGATSAGTPGRSRVIGPEPYRLYVLGQRALNLRGQSIQASADMFRRATEIDSLYGDAFAGLSLALALTPHFKPVPPRDLEAEAREAATRALRLDSSLALAHVALGIVHSHANRWDSAGAEFREGVRLRSPSDVEPLVQYGRYLLFRGQHAEALRQFLLARSTEPASALVRSWVSYAYFLRGEMDSALVENARAFQSDSLNLTTLTLGSQVRLRAGDIAGARDYVRRIGGHPQESFYVLTMTGDSGIARERVDELRRQRSAPWLIDRVEAYRLLATSDTIGAIAAFERATNANDVWPARIPISDPMFNSVRSHPRFQRLLQRVGLR